MVFGPDGGAVDGIGAQVAYEFETTAAGGVEIDPEQLFQHSAVCITEAEKQAHRHGIGIHAATASGFWHSFLGLDREGRPVTPVMHLLDTRATAEVRWLKSQINQRAAQSRVGCVFHTSYWPARLMWIKKNRPEEWLKAARWVSFGEYLFERLLGTPAESTSMMSASGLWDQNRNAYDAEILETLGLRPDQLADPDTMDRPITARGYQWFPMIGDGAANNLGSGCITPGRFGLMVGTTGAMRAVLPAPELDIPWGAWCYRIDRRRFVVGGALSDGGKVFEWMTENFRGLEPGPAIEAELAAMVPGAHGLTFLPLFAGERSPNWNADARAAITGLGLHTRPIDLLRAALESVACRFRMVYDILVDRVGAPEAVVASGGALLRSPAWTQMMADSLGRPVVACAERETSCRGAALLALERLEVAPLDSFGAATGDIFEPIPSHLAAFAEMLDKQKELYGLLYS